jgi:hypothetical protein
MAEMTWQDKHDLEKYRDTAQARTRETDPRPGRHRTSKVMAGAGDSGARPV